MNVNGGANCIVTNGIHFLDLACSVFEKEPTNVFAKVESKNINPRGKHLGFGMVLYLLVLMIVVSIYHFQINQA